MYVHSSEIFCYWAYVYSVLCSVSFARGSRKVLFKTRDAEIIANNDTCVAVRVYNSLVHKLNNDIFKRELFTLRPFLTDNYKYRSQ